MNENFMYTIATKDLIKSTILEMVYNGELCLDERSISIGRKDLFLSVKDNNSNNYIHNCSRRVRVNEVDLND